VKGKGTKVVAVVPAAGAGRRMGGGIPKQLLEIGGKPVVIRTLETLDRCPAVDGVILVVPGDRVEGVKEAVATWRIQKVFRVVPGGAERQDSVQRGMDVLPDGVEIVVVHDGVRPFVAAEKVEEVVEAARYHGGAVLAVPAKNTIKRGVEGWVEETLRREFLWQVQTPQAFRAEWIKEAYEKAKQEGCYTTDDAALVERLGHRVRIVRGDEENIKITSPLDILLGEALLRRKAG